MQSQIQKNIFKNGGRTFYYSSLFFPKSIRDKVTVLYSFLRVADDLVDAIPSKEKRYFEFKNEYIKADRLGYSKDLIIDSFVKLKNELGFDDEWIEAFFTAMEMDLHGHKFTTIRETLNYTYGVAEIVGFMMAKILELPKEAMHFAQVFGRAGQYANMIRDIAEDLELGRIYMPAEDMETFKLKSLAFDYTLNHKEEFLKFTEFQLGRHDAWMLETEKGYKLIPKRYRITVKTAGDLYNHWTMDEIKKDPFVIYKKSVKPSKLRVLLTGIRNSFLA